MRNVFDNLLRDIDDFFDLGPEVGHVMVRLRWSDFLGVRKRGCGLSSLAIRSKGRF